MTIVYAIIMLLLLIFVHETGHLISAKMTGVKVSEFALGMGPKLFGFQKGETLYTFRAIPFGGFCALGEDDEDGGDDPRAFLNKPARVRAWILFAGSLMNILLAIVLMSVIIFSMGLASRVLSEVTETSPAYADGLRAGDELIAINGVPVEEWGDITPILEGLTTAHPDNNPDLALTVLRDGETKVINTHLYKDTDGKLRLGISPKPVRTVSFFFKSFGYGFKSTMNMGKMMYEVLGQLVSGKQGIDQLMGPVGIVVTVGDAVSYGFVNFVYLTALISLNLGIVNLLPFPALDGGRLLFLLIRKITGKAITNEIEGRVHLIGIIVLFAFIGLVTLQDIGRFFVP